LLWHVSRYNKKYKEAPQTIIQILSKLLEYQAQACSDIRCISQSKTKGRRVQFAPKGSNTDTPYFKLCLGILEIKKHRIPFKATLSRFVRGRGPQGITYLFEIAEANTRLGSNCGWLNVEVYQELPLNVQ
jgi:hypothetical protein